MFKSLQHAWGVAVIAALLTTSCVNTRLSDTFVGDEAGFSRHSAGYTALMYIPNRVVDAVDLAHVGVAFGPALGLEAQATRALRFESASGSTVGLGWFGRGGESIQATSYEKNFFGPPEPSPSYEQRIWHTPYWDFALHLHLGIVTVYVGVAPLDEAFDLVTGIFTYDLKGDDF